MITLIILLLLLILFFWLRGFVRDLKDSVGANNFSHKKTPQKAPSRKSTEKVDLATIDKRKFGKDQGEYVSFTEEKKSSEESN